VGQLKDNFLQQNRCEMSCWTFSLEKPTDIRYHWFSGIWGDLQWKVIQRRKVVREKPRLMRVQLYLWT